MMQTAVAEVSKESGAFVRSDSTFRNSVGTEKYPIEPNRYILVVSYACPWAHRCLIVRSLFGLEHAIPIYSVHPTWERTKPSVDDHQGWVFAHDRPVIHPISGKEIETDEHCSPPPEEKWTSVRSIYESVSNKPMKKFTVPVLYDSETKSIVNNESSEIIRMLGSRDLFGLLATKNKDLQLLPEKSIAEIDEVNSWVYTTINNGVYKCGFAQTQKAYTSAAEKLEEGLLRVESILSKRRFLCSDDEITEADIRLFPTLIRHDEVYTVYFKANHVPIVTGTRFPNIVRYMKDLLKIKEIKITVDMRHIKAHYYTSHPQLNRYGIVPVGPNVMRLLEE